MTGHMMLKEMGNSKTQLNIMEDILPIIAKELLPHLNNADHNTRPSLEEEDVEMKIEEAIMSAYGDKLNGNELNKWLSHKCCRPGGYLYNLAFYHSLLSLMQKNGVSYVY